MWSDDFISCCLGLYTIFCTTAPGSTTYCSCRSRIVALSGRSTENFLTPDRQVYSFEELPSLHHDQIDNHFSVKPSTTDIEIPVLTEKEVQSIFSSFKAWENNISTDSNNNFDEKKTVPESLRMDIILTPEVQPLRYIPRSCLTQPVGFWLKTLSWGGLNK